MGRLSLFFIGLGFGFLLCGIYEWFPMNLKLSQNIFGLSLLLAFIFGLLHIVSGPPKNKTLNSPRTGHFRQNLGQKRTSSGRTSA